MWELLVVIVRLPVLLLGLALFTLIGVPLIVGRCCLVVVSSFIFSFLSFPFVVIGALFNNEPKKITSHFPNDFNNAVSEMGELKEVGNSYKALLKWGFVQK